MVSATRGGTDAEEARRLRRCHVVGGAGRNVTLGMMGRHVVQGSRGVAREWMGGRGKDQAGLRLNNHQMGAICLYLICDAGAICRYDGNSRRVMPALLNPSQLEGLAPRLRPLRHTPWRPTDRTTTGATSWDRARKTSSPPSSSTRGLRYLFTPRAAGGGTSHVSRRVTRACIDVAHCSDRSHPSATDGCYMSFRPQAQFHQLSLPLPSDHQLSASPLAHLRTTLFDRLLAP